MAARMIDNTSPELLAVSKRETMTSIEEQEYMLWRHNPITAGYLQYLADQIDKYRSWVADIVEAGTAVAGSPHISVNLDALRGQLFMLRQLHGLELKDIHAFYGKEPPEGDQA